MLRNVHHPGSVCWGNNRLKDHGKLDSDLTLLGRFKDIPCWARWCWLLPEYADWKNQMSGFRSGHGLYGFIITHLTQKDHIGALASVARRVRWLSVSEQISRWLTMQRSWRWIFQRILQGDDGPSRVWLIRSIRQAMVVDLPLPAEPVTRTIPRYNRRCSSHPSGMESSAGSGSRKAITRDHGSQGTTLFISC